MKQVFSDYLRSRSYDRFDVRAVLFDMDGVLYNSMPAHEKSWQQTAREFNLKAEPNEFFLLEGRTGSSTINILFERTLGRKATAKEIQRIYSRKTELFSRYNTGEVIPGAGELLKLVQSEGLQCILVTGSGQPSLIDKLEGHFPGIFTSETMVTGFDVKIGKPNPEPFLMGLQKGGNLKPWQALVVENAPLGTEAARRAGIFTIDVNTGPLPDKVLYDAGANLVFPNMSALLDQFPEILKSVRT
ncbi:MAG: HAD hydrolase-like protein [Dysgonamonadaceae bacterium]|nr:HAD hydrolase-like protein [Dysgonamonadaceae bacterium]